jgi:hypothetical protein
MSQSSPGHQGLPVFKVGLLAWITVCEHTVPVAAVHKPSTVAGVAEMEPGGSCQGFLATSALAATGNSGRHQLSRGVPSPEGRLARPKVLGACS